MDSLFIDLPTPEPKPVAGSLLDNSNIPLSVSNEYRNSKENRLILVIVRNQDVWSYTVNVSHWICFVTDAIVLIVWIIQYENWCIDED